MISNRILSFQISTDVEGQGTWEDCFSVDGVFLPTGYYFGVSAATGDLAGESSFRFISSLSFLQDLLVDLSLFD